MNKLKIKYRGKSSVEAHSEIYIPQVNIGDWIFGGVIFDYDYERIWIDIPYYGALLVDKDTIGLCSNQTDKNQKEIYQHDIVKYNNYFNDCIGVVRFGEYKQDGSSGEYDSILCYGFYIERIKVIPNDEYESNNEDMIYKPDWGKTISLLTYANNLEVIGNEFDNMGLVEIEESK